MSDFLLSLAYLGFHLSTPEVKSARSCSPEVRWEESLASPKSAILDAPRGTTEMTEGDDACNYPGGPAPMLECCVTLGTLLTSLSLSFLTCKLEVKQKLIQRAVSGLYEVTYRRHLAESLAYNQHSIIIIYYRSTVCYL